MIARRADGIDDVTAASRGLSFAGDERAVAALTLELAQAGIGLRALVPRTATLEELFFRMTEGDPRERPRRCRCRTAPPRPARRRSGRGPCPRRVREVEASPRRRSPPRRSRRPGVRTVYAWELRKLAAQKRTYIGLGCALLVPLIFITALLADDGGPEGIPFGDYVRETGLAIPLVGLYFGAFWFFPLVTALVAGDIVATEDGNGTLKTILTRSVDRWQIFVAKVLAAFTYAFSRARALRRRRARCSAG